MKEADWCQLRRNQMPFIVLLLSAGAFFIYGWTIYNSLKKFRYLIKNSYFQMDAHLKKRYDLIHSLVETTKANLKYNRDTISTVIKALSTAQSLAQTISGNPMDSMHMRLFLAAESVLTESSHQFLNILANNPDIASNKITNQIMEDLKIIESHLSISKQDYNDLVLAHNKFIKKFPNSIVAQTFHFEIVASFEIAEL